MIYILNTVSRKRSWSKHDLTPQTTSKTDSHQKKIMLSVMWVWKGVVYFELFPRNQTINSNVYCQQLDKLNAAINDKRPELINRKDVIFHQDNARPHTSLVIRQKLRQLGWELLMYSPYSPDLAPLDCHFFLSLQSSLNDKTLKSLKLQFFQFIAEKSQKFYERGIINLPKRWQK